MIRYLFLSFPIIAIASGLAWAEPDKRDRHHHHGHVLEEGSAKSESTLAYEAANARMHEGMNAALTGNADVDFMQGMIPHHQGAIDMTEIVLKYGKDPETRALAEEIIKAQTDEIALMKNWLAKRGK